MVTISVPPCKSYQGGLAAVPCIALSEPREGNKLVNLQIDWGTMASDQGGVSVNLQSNATLEFSQIVALSVDNSQCGSDIQFTFPDTGETTTVPAYAPKVIIEVFTNQQQFFVVANNFRAEDITRFSILNFLPPPTSIPVTVEQQSVAANNIVADGAHVEQLVPIEISGTLLGIQVLRTSPLTTAGTQLFEIIDGFGQLLFTGQFNVANNTEDYNVILLDFPACHLRFNNGLQMTQGGVNVGGSYCVNLLYRTP